MTETTIRPVQTGDVFVASWGYDQTNVDYYKVDRATDRTAWIVPIGATSIKGSEGFMSDSVVPDPDVVLCDHCNAGPDGYLHNVTDDRRHRYEVTATRHRIRTYGDNVSLKVRDWGVWAHRIEGAGRHYRSWYE